MHNRQTLFLFLVLFLYGPACFALKLIFNKKAAGSKNLRLFCFGLLAFEKTVIDGRRDVENILQKKDDRLLVIAGPCSIHDIDAALEYAHKMNQLRQEVKDYNNENIGA